MMVSLINSLHNILHVSLFIKDSYLRCKRRTQCGSAPQVCSAQQIDLWYIYSNRAGESENIPVLDEAAVRCQ